MADSDWTRTRVSARLGIRYPIIQGALGGLASQRLTAAVSNFGGLGSFGALAMPPSALQEVIAELRSLTDRPFAVNLWVSMQDEAALAVDEAAWRRNAAALAPLVESLGGTLPSYVRYAPASFEARARVLIDARVPAFSFVFGIPPAEILDECRAREIVTLGSATTPEEALALERARVDVIVAAGFEGGGHRGSFLRPTEESLFGTLALVPRVRSSVSAPVVAAGGIADARGIVAALALGAEGVQLGTAFAACEESGASPLYRAALLGGKAGQTVLTRAFTGRFGRGIANRLFESLSASGVEPLPYPLQRQLVQSLSAAAEQAGRPEWMPMWAGQSASLLEHGKARELLQDLVSGVSQWPRAEP
ncbi:MAG TPA: nitronate monooxygenase [Myxococcota bacterium]|nr:nitronate monooxygenase [Myxococcota bacterium]